MGCNTAQNEVGGKDLLIKACILDEVATTNLSSSLTANAHGLKVGDVVKFEEVGALTVVDTSTFYYVKEIVDANTFKISATKSGVVIAMDATEATLDIELFKQIGGIRSKSMSISAEGIDITSEDSDEWKVFLDKAGMRSVEISGSGVHSNSLMLKQIEDKMLANELTCLMFLEWKNGKIYAGCFKITSLEYSGDHDGEGSMSISASSSGAITRATIAA
jgi:TP901-1 family phage major tail protein